MDTLRKNGSVIQLILVIRMSEIISFDNKIETDDPLLSEIMQSKKEMFHV